MCYKYVTVATVVSFRITPGVLWMMWQHCMSGWDVPSHEFPAIKAKML